MDRQQCTSKTCLHASLIQNSNNVDHDVNSWNEKYYGKAEIITELKKQMRLAGPLVIVSFLQYSLQMISVMFVGRLGVLSLSSASMATSFAGVTGFGFMLGMGAALETLCGQAYGAKQYHMLGVHMQRAMLVLALVNIPISLLWSCTEPIFRFLKQDPQISMFAGIYARCLIPAIIPYGFLQCQLRFLQTQNNVLPLVLSTGITSLVHVVVCWTLVFGFGFGNEGAALSISISYWTNVLILAIYIKFSPSCQETWTGFSMQGTKNLFSFLKLGIPSALMVCFEFCSYEFLVIMSGLLPNPKLELSMMSISLNTSSVVFRIPFGLGSAVSTRVSNELGAGRPYTAQLAVQVVIFLAVIEGVALSLILVAVRDVWGLLYTSEKEVVRYLASVIPVLATSNFMDGMQAVLSGTARGCGWQKIGVYVNLGAYYLVGLPSAVVMSFVFHLGGKGLWMGIICGSFLQALLLLAIAMNTEWELEAKKARDRIYASSILIDTSAEEVWL
ncbi:protein DETOXIFICATION 16 isoform X2 [Ricinus communis]|uniref:protein DETOXIFICATION 16 isoform X2 n=1 Tax=Ricinus communis TaxID=3988 RepID=UPI00201AD8A4|nr:protein DETOXIFICATION 16 isoform X2 [Ricinus communis]